MNLINALNWQPKPKLDTTESAHTSWSCFVVKLLLSRTQHLFQRSEPQLLPCQINTSAAELLSRCRETAGSNRGEVTWHDMPTHFQAVVCQPTLSPSGPGAAIRGNRARRRPAEKVSDTRQLLILAADLYSCRSFCCCHLPLDVTISVGQKSIPNHFQCN